jgi:hypothetical protein
MVVCTSSLTMSFQEKFIFYAACVKMKKFDAKYSFSKDFFFAQARKNEVFSRNFM